MANVLHRTTKQFLQSVNTPDYPILDWIHNPDLSLVVSFNSKYWVITGDNVTLMSQGEIDAIDAQELSDSRDSISNELDQVDDILRAFALVMLDEINLHAQRITAILDAIDNANNLTSLKTEIALINDVPTRTISQIKTAVRSKLGS